MMIHMLERLPKWVISLIIMLERLPKWAIAVTKVFKPTLNRVN